MRQLVLQQLHDHSGHLGVAKTLGKLKERFYWPGYERDVEEWLLQCQPCQRRNPLQHNPRAPLGTVRAHYPFEKVSWDITGPLPLTVNGNRYILVVTDLFTKWVEAFRIQATDSQTLASVFVKEIVCHYGIPTVLHSDQGANLTSALITNMCQLLGIERTRTTAYHPQGNGQVERFNRTLKMMLSKVVTENQSDWDVHLPTQLMAYCTAIHESTGFSPFRVLFGQSPTLPVDLLVPLPSEAEPVSYPRYVSNLKHLLKQAYQNVQQLLTHAHIKQKTQYDKKFHDLQLRVGDMVYLHTPVVKNGRSRKLTSPWTGPYSIVDRPSQYNVRIHLIGGRKNLVVHVNRLKPFYGIPQDTPIPDTQSLEVVVETEEGIGGYVSLGEEEGNADDTGEIEMGTLNIVSRPQRIRNLPDHYGTYVTH